MLLIGFCFAVIKYSLTVVLLASLLLGGVLLGTFYTQNIYRKFEINL